jgi:hypothetical protein
MRISETAAQPLPLCRPGEIDGRTRPVSERALNPRAGSHDDLYVSRPMNSTLGAAIRDILHRHARSKAPDAGGGREKRTAERFAFRVPMLVRVHDTEQEIRGWLRNVSATGLGFALSAAVPVGAHLEVGFEDVNLDAALGVPFLQCVVTRCDDAGDGVYVVGTRFALAGKFEDRHEIPTLSDDDLGKVRDAIFE